MDLELAGRKLKESGDEYAALSLYVQTATGLLRIGPAKFKKVAKLFTELGLPSWWPGDIDLMISSDRDWPFGIDVQLASKPELPPPEWLEACGQ